MRVYQRLAVGFIFVWAISSIAASAARADVKLPAILSENMILQQKAIVPIWGWAGEGERVTVHLQDQELAAVPKNGRWSVNFKNLKAGGPFTMTIKGKNKIEFKNVMVGEVWLCSGQSNMYFALKTAAGGAADVAASAHPKIRLFQVPLCGATEPLDDMEGASWQECGPASSADFSAVAYYFAKSLQNARNVPVGVINASFGGSVAVAWVRRATLAANPGLRFWLDDFAKTVEQYETAHKESKPAKSYRLGPSPSARASGRASAPASAPASGRGAAKTPIRAERHPYETSGMPSGLFNGMIAPVLPFAVKGILWYQGESDSHRSAQYRPLFRTLIRDWRGAWNNKTMPFLFVQLAGFGGRSARASATAENINASWPWLREAQTDALVLNNTAMAVAIDVGDPADIHPTRKQPVGERLALAARAVAYGEKIVYSGPIYNAMKKRDGKIALAFKRVGSGLVSRGGELTGFEICGANRKFVPAKAEISGRKVIVSSPDVANPRAVRYAWSGNPACNLYNQEGLPASPFRTDRVEKAAKIAK